MNCDICKADAPTLSISTSGCGCCDGPADVCVDCARTRPLRDLLTASWRGRPAMRVLGSHYDELTAESLNALLASEVEARP